MGRETLYPLPWERFSKQTIWHFKRGWNKTVPNRLCGDKENGKSELELQLPCTCLADGEPTRKFMYTQTGSRPVLFLIPV